MAPRTKKSTSSASDSLEMAKAINSIVSKGDAFASALEFFQNLKEDTLTAIDLELRTRRDELEALQKDFETKKKDFEIQLTQECNEMQYQAALKFLEEVGEQPIKTTEFNRMQTDLTELRNTCEAEAKKQQAIVTANLNKEHTMALRTQELEHKAEIATLRAQVEQLMKERETYQETIANLKSEIAAQRDLTRQVAEASKQGAISQNFGK